MKEICVFSILVDIYRSNSYMLVINQKECKISMKKIVRLTDSELKQLMENCVTRALQKKAVVNEHVDWEREITLAQKTLMKMSPLLTDLGLRLDGTRFRLLYLDVRDSLIALNNALIQHIKGEGKK